MEAEYTVKGADGKQYGPATLEQMSEWIKQGRIPAQQQVKRDDMDYWAPAGEFQELKPFYQPAPVAAVTPATIAAPTPSTTSAGVASPQIKSAGAWFYWVAALSLVNSVVAFTGSTWRFILGLGITQVIDGFGAQMASGGKVVALVLDLLAAAVFVLFGVFAQKGHAWAFMVGMILFALDGVIFLLVQDWLGVGFHVFVLYVLFKGLQACRAKTTTA